LNELNEDTVFSKIIENKDEKGSSNKKRYRKQYTKKNQR